MEKIFKKIINAGKKLFNEAFNEHTTLIYNFELCKQKLLEKNKEETINRMIPQIRKIILTTEGLLITNEQARKSAIEIFETAKECGAIDCMNTVIKQGA